MLFPAKNTPFLELPSGQLKGFNNNHSKIEPAASLAKEGTITKIL
jgi:hypothetical protein